MDELTPPPAIPPPAPQPGEPHPAGPRRQRRRLILALVGLYALSLAAAVVLLLRGGAADRAKKEGAAEAAKGLLTLSQQKESVGWLAIRGPIYSSDGGKLIEKGVEQWGRRLRALAETKGVKAIVLDINSPGGSVGAVQELYSQILRVRRENKVPVVALFGDVAASGGYYLAAACDKIVAHPGSLTGSIGVIFSVGNLEGLFQKIGYKSQPIKSGRLKDIGSPARPMTAEERELLQRLIDETHRQFMNAVMSGRKMSDEAVRKLADGRIFTGKQALEAGLVDALGDSTDALELAGKLGGISGRPKVKRDSERLGELLELFEMRLRSGLGLPSAPAWLESLGAPGLPGLEYRWAGW